MAELQVEKKVRARKTRHKGRGSQIGIYLGKQLRFFINESDWKVLPMSAVIAALVGMVIRNKFFINMEGGLIGAFALTCTSIWNGCFNSIQSVCRERAIIKREHRSGMHISSYVAAHMIYQFMLCVAQTGLSMYVLMMMKVRFPAEGFMTPWMVVDIGITMLIITYASDMLSLFISSVSRTTTGAMTVMPFVLIFQLVFSGGIIPLPAWSQSLANFTISNYGIKAIAAQSGYNELPMVTAWNTLEKMKDNEIGGTATLGQILDLLDSPAVEKRRDTEVLKSYTVGEVADILSSAEETLHLRDKVITHPMTVREFIHVLQTNDALQGLRERVLIPSIGHSTPVTVGSLLDSLVSTEELSVVLDKQILTTITLGQVLDFLHAEDVVNAASDQVVNQSVTLGDIADFLKNNSAIQAQRDRTITLKTSIGDLFELFGEENIKTLVQEKTAAASQKAEYDRTEENIIGYWIMLILFIFAFALMATLALELIDKDKR